MRVHLRGRIAPEGFEPFLLGRVWACCIALTRSVEREMKDSNPQSRFWRPLVYQLTESPVRGERRDSNPRCQDHNLECLPLHYTHREVSSMGLEPMATGFGGRHSVH